MDQDRSAALGLSGCSSVCIAILASVIASVNWITLHSDDECEGGMHNYIYGVAISSTIQIAIFGLGFILAAVSMCLEPLQALAIAYNVVFLGVLSIFSGVLNLLWLVWGILLLVDHHCEDTMYHTMTIVSVVLSGLSILGNLSHNKTQRK